MISGASITLLVGGSIAAYKSAELVRELVKRGAKVRVVLSEAAEKFITPMTMQTLSGNKVATEMFELIQEAEIGHIKLADTDVVVAAPATANLIAKAAAGIADDFPSAILLATKSPVVIAPAMNVNMWEHPVTRRNVQMLRGLGVQFVAPEEGELACGTVGVGRLAELCAIIDAIDYALTPKDLAGSKVVVTAGPTREAVDPIRFLSNRSSGKMGFALARAAKSRGADVTLISGPVNLKTPYGVTQISVQSAEEMREQVMNCVTTPDSKSNGIQYVFMAAAVSDHRPASYSENKVKKDKSKGFEQPMEPCPDILQLLGNSREEIEKSSLRPLKLIGFTAETGTDEDLLRTAKDKLTRKKIDMIVGNIAQDSFEKDTNRVWLLDNSGRQEEVTTADKNAVAERIIQVALCC